MNRFVYIEVAVLFEYNTMAHDAFNRIVPVPALFNNGNLLEFSIEPDKRSLVLGKSYLQFFVELPEDFVPDNNFGQKMFEYLDLNIQYEDCSFKCSKNDNDYTSHIYDKLFRNPGYLRKLKFEGHYDDYNTDSSELKDNPELVKNRRGKLVTKSVDEEGQTKQANYYLYQIIVPINHGLCSDNQVLPSGVRIRLTFHRAEAKKALVDISDQIIKYPTNTIELIEPILNVCWTFSPTMGPLTVPDEGLSVPFEATHIRHRVLDNGLAEQSIQVQQGPLPKSIVFFLVEPYRFENDLKYSSSNFKMHDLKEFSLLLDNEVMQHYPLKVENYGGTRFYHEFYRRWLTMIGQYGDSNEDILNEDTFISENFMIVETFQDFEHKEGILTAKLKFFEPLSNKLYLCWMPVTQKELKFDRNLSVHVV